MKLDAGDPRMFARLNGGKTSIRCVIDGLRALSPITVQAMFGRDRNHEVDNSTEAAVDHWLWALETTRAERVHVYTHTRSHTSARLRDSRTRSCRRSIFR